ncbi:unnamed protein product [Rangifer tarandus platyrhynchus]|uniref:Uncharacterized protein n=1 Tax=Rangifer tarandus platyrhynchus TaxID=3082113 RepID=A0ABN8XTA8_RANTA|nr:unnamed protein product [Rangifer tarandus platyrhynchus]
MSRAMLRGCLRVQGTHWRPFPSASWVCSSELLAVTPLLCWRLQAFWSVTLAGVCPVGLWVLGQRSRPTSAFFSLQNFLLWLFCPEKPTVPERQPVHESLLQGGFWLVDPGSLEGQMNNNVEELAFSYITMCCAKSLHSCPTLCNPVDCSPPGPSVQGILQSHPEEPISTGFIHVVMCLGDPGVCLPMTSPVTQSDAQHRPTEPCCSFRDRLAVGQSFFSHSTHS